MSEIAVDKSQKSEFVKNLFSSISKKYDLTNDMITFGLARLWRKKVVELSFVEPGQKILDCATGTGDLAFEFKKKVGASGDVTGIDFCKEMLDLAPVKSRDLNLPVHFEVADVLKLDFKDSTFDVTSIAYGIRNVADVNIALREMARVTKPGGSVMILETGEVKSPVLKYFIRIYFEKIVPLIGGLFSGHKEAYHYLQSSSGAFPSGDEFCVILKKTGHFESVSCTPLMGGASYIYRAKVKSTGV